MIYRVDAVEYPAIIVRVYEPAEQPPLCDLEVFGVWGDARIRRKIAEGTQSGSWHWPERV